MNEIPYLDFLSYAQMKRKPGLYISSFESAQDENAGLSLIFHQIAQAIEKDPLRKIFISFGEFHYSEELIKFLDQRKLKGLIYLCSNYEHFSQVAQDFTAKEISALFIANEDFFQNINQDQLTVGIAQKAKNAQRFYNQKIMKQIACVVLKKITATYSAFGNNAKVDTATSYHAQSIVKVKTTKNVTKLSVVKNKLVNPGLNLNFKISKEHEWSLDEALLEPQPNFFEFQEEGALIINQNDCQENIASITDFFKAYNPSKKIKKIILEKSIHRSENEKYPLITLNCDLVNLFILFKNTYQEDFDPNHFISNTENIDLFDDAFINMALAAQFPQELSLLLKAFPQSHSYKWINSHQTDFDLLRDTLSIIKSLNQKQIPFLLDPKIKDLQNIHDDLSLFLEAHSGENAEIPSQNKIKEWNEKEIVLDNSVKLQVHIPMHNYELKKIGQEMKLCIKDSWFWESLVAQDQNIVIVKNGEELKYCIKLDNNYNILEAKSKFNKELSDDLILQLAHCIDQLAS